MIVDVQCTYVHVHVAIEGPRTGGGVVYTHWGRTSCPSGQGTELQEELEGLILSVKGGGKSCCTCMPDDPGAHNNSRLEFRMSLLREVECWSKYTTLMHIRPVSLFISCTMYYLGPASAQLVVCSVLSRV